jgi:D12 class N6 adenine-specific DNA methyltransferase
MPKMTETRPTRPLAAYVGGKRLLARTIIERINAIEHETYVEPFVGMGGVFLRRSMKPQAEVINDGSGDVATLFRVLQRHYTAFVDMIRWQLTSRREFERLAAALSRLEGTFILSLNDCEGVRATFKSFRIEAVTTRYCVGGGASSKEAGEVLIMGGSAFLKKMPFDLARDAI